MKLSFKYLFVLFLNFVIITQLRAQQAKNVTLQLKWKHQFQFAGYYAASEKGFYREAGIKVNFVEAVEGKDPTDAVVEGKAEFGVCTSDILLLRAQHKKVVVLATIFQHSPQILLASKQSGIEHVHDLIGKRIAMEPNAADIIAYMNDEGVGVGKCIIDNHTFEANKLISGEIDAISAYSTDEPFVLKNAGFEYTILTPAMGGIDFYGDVLFTTEALIGKDPRLVENFRKASLKGWQYAMDHPQEIIDLIYKKYSKRHSKEHLAFEAEHMKNLIMDSVVEMGYTNPGRWNSISDTYKKLKMIDPSFTTEGLLYSDYIEPKMNIPWKLITSFLLVILMVGSVSYFYYNMSGKLKKELTERQRIENDLNESSDKHRILFQNSPDAYLILIDGIFTDCNRAAERMLGGDRTQIVGQTPELISPQFQPDGRKSSDSAKEKIKVAFESGFNTFEWVHRRFNGSDILVDISIASMLLKEKPALFITWRDITDRKLVEIALKESEDKFRTAFYISPDAITLSRLRDKAIVSINKGFTDVMGYTEEDVVGKSSLQFDLWVDLADRARMFEILTKTGKVENFEAWFYTKDKELRYGLMSLIVLDINGEPHALNITRDITARKQTEIEIKLKNEELQKLNSEKDKFFSIIAHDLRGPFNGFLGLSKLMADELHDLTQQEVLKIAVSMRNSATNLFHLLENLLEWSRLQRGLTAFEPRPLLLMSMITEIMHPVMDSSVNKQIVIRYEIPSELEVFADEYMLASTIRNLASNAVKFTPKGGNITIAAKPAFGNSVEISVTDTGIGMNSGMVDDLFRLDVQTNRKGTDGEPSSGLGLLLCKDFIEKHGGKLWVKSEEGIGSTFYFTI